MREIGFGSRGFLVANSGGSWLQTVEVLASLFFDGRIGVVVTRLWSAWCLSVFFGSSFLGRFR